MTVNRPVMAKLERRTDPNSPLQGVLVFGVRLDGERWFTAESAWADFEGDPRAVVATLLERVADKLTGVD